MGISKIGKMHVYVCYSILFILKFKPLSKTASEVLPSDLKISYIHSNLFRMGRDIFNIPEKICNNFLKRLIILNFTFLTRTVVEIYMASDVQLSKIFLPKKIVTIVTQSFHNWSLKSLFLFYYKADISEYMATKTH